MLRVKTKVLSSPIHGLGLYADELIAKDTVLWSYDRDLDPVVPIERVVELCALNPVFADYVRHRGYEDKTLPGLVVFNLDNEQFKNDSTTPNTYVSAENETRASMDIQPGEELTVNYEHFLVDSTIALRIDWRERLA